MDPVLRSIAGGVYMPVNEEMDIEPQHGKDIVITLDSRIQEIAESALMKMMTGNEAEHGCAIVMEVKTGKIKAIANLGRNANGTYWENFNYALTPTEPGSTFKLASLMTVLENNTINLNNYVDLEGGVWKVHGRTVYDSERHGKHNVTIKRAFELSSNVGMAKLVYSTYSEQPAQFVNHLKSLGFNVSTGVDIYGERNAVLYEPGDKHWSSTTLPWMSFGYNLAITPLHTAMFYNAVANNGTMMKPYLLSAIKKNGITVFENQPIILKDSICSKKTLNQLQDCLIGVCSQEGATAFNLFKESAYAVAGKTGTALVANGSIGYGNHIYQSSFAGFFPANAPKYTCVVIIKNKPHAAKYYGALVAGPVFKEIADKLHIMDAYQCNKPLATAKFFQDSSTRIYTGTRTDMHTIYAALQKKIADSAVNKNAPFAQLHQDVNQATIKNNLSVLSSSMPALDGLGLKDALYACEQQGLIVKVKGMGKVAAQSIPAGIAIKEGQHISIYLN